MTLVSDAEIKRLLLALSSWFQLDYEVVDVCVPEVLDRVCNRWIPIRLPRLMLADALGTVRPTATSWYCTRTQSFSNSTFMPGTTLARSCAFAQVATAALKQIAAAIMGITVIIHP